MSPRLVDAELYELGRNAGRSAGRLTVAAAAQIRDSVIDATQPAQMNGWLDGLAETREEAPEWPLPFLDHAMEVAV